MPPRPTTPSEDLYARLGVPRDASIEAIDLAWRGLLRRHHPDVAGADGLELAKRINVAHDWLSDPELRRRYDRERTGGIRDGRPPRGGPSERDTRPAPVRTVRRPPTIEEQLAAVVERVSRLSRDELDRLALSEPAPIAFLATLRRFATGEAQATLDEAIRAALGALPATARRRPAIRDAVVGRLAEIVLGEALDDLLGESGGVRARERLARGWEAAVGQPRYGPATAVVEAFIDRLRAMTPDDARDLAASGRGALGPPPWPGSTSPDEDETLRVSS
ncbi:MAG TPA: DnaJ domain-containing protein, partial [Candidatus Bathyarchaeia archaeon]|nr:DnaJ domain-containing protein [Candidatus Bathyarchaeia archaeon]